MISTNLIEAGIKENTDLAFTWIVTDYCQYNCSYCCSVDINQNELKESNIWKFVIAKLKKMDIKFKISLLGGEPTLHKDIFKIIKALDNIGNCTSIDLISNFQKPNEFYESLNSLNSKKLEMTISYHSEYHKGFLEKLETFNPHYNVAVSVCVYEKHLDKCKLVLEHKKFNTYPTFLFDTSAWKNNIGIPKEFKKYFIEEDKHEISIPYTYNDGIRKYKSHEIFDKKLNKFKGFKCRRLVYRINADGNFVDVCDKSNIGMLPTKEKLLSYKTCTMSECSCAEYFEFHKVK